MVDLALKIITSKWASRVIFTVSLIANILLGSNLYQTNTELKVAQKRTESLSNELIEVKAKDSIRESEITKWQRLTNEKQQSLNEETAKRIEIENKLAKTAKTRWEHKKFTGDHKADINILRDHALKLKEDKQ